MELIFVYGTLKREYDNWWARLMWSGAQDFGAAAMAGRMYNVGGYPAMIEAQAADETVHGQVAGRENTVDLFRRLDAYEGSEYRREKREATLENGERVEAWVYFYTGSAREERKIADGRWKQRE